MKVITVESTAGQYSARASREKVVGYIAMGQELEKRNSTQYKKKKPRLSSPVNRKQNPRTRGPTSNVFTTTNVKHLQRASEKRK